MAKGYVYIMTTGIDGIIKIKKGNEWKEHRKEYKNGLTTYFVVECNDCEEIESVMHDVFHESRVIASDDRKTELFACKKERAKRILEKMGNQIYPDNSISEPKKDEKIPKSKRRVKHSAINFYKCGLKDGDKLVYVEDESIVATVAGEHKVIFEDEITSLSNIVGKIKGRKAVQGPAFFTYNGELLTKLAERTQWKND